MRWAVPMCLLLGLGACKVLFQAEGDDDGTGDDAPPIDAAIDAPAGPPTIELIPPPAVFAGMPAAIVVRTSGVREVHVRLSATDGRFPESQAMDVQRTIPAGIRDTSFTWSPPDTYTTVQLAGLASFDPNFTEPVPTSTMIGVQQHLGKYVVIGTSVSLPANTLRATTVDIPKAGHLTGLGVQLTVVAGTKLKLALYSNNGSLPFALVATSDVLDVANFPSGRVEFTFPQPVQLLPNVHWVAVIADKATNLIGASVGPNPQDQSRNFNFGLNLPASFQPEMQRNDVMGAYAMLGP